MLEASPQWVSSLASSPADALHHRSKLSCCSKIGRYNGGITFRQRVSQLCFLRIGSHQIFLPCNHLTHDILGSCDSKIHAMDSEHPTLAALPPELILLIADFLNPDDLACVSLCNRQLITFLQAQRRRQRTPQLSPREEQQIRMSILTRLERDLPNYFVCHSCNFLHSYDGSDGLGICGPHFQGICPLPCLRRLPQSYGSAGTNLRLDLARCAVFGFNFYFTHLQLSMRQLYHGPQAGLSTEALSYTEFQPRECKESLSAKEHGWTRWTCKGITLFSIEAQICPDPPNLCLRTQEIMRSPIAAAQYLFICAHVSTPGFCTSMGNTDANLMVDKKVTSLARKCHKCKIDRFPD